jgi:hypothetical protein
MYIQNSKICINTVMTEIKKKPTVIEIIVIVLLRLNLLQMNNQWCIGSESFEGSNFYIGIIENVLPQKNSFLQNQI